MGYSTKTDDVIINEITGRVKQRRLNLNMTQGDVAQKSGLHAQTIKNFEQGKSIKLKTLIRIMRVLGELDSLDHFLPQKGASPIELLKLKGKERVRASGKSKEHKGNAQW
ncbi:MAG: transcriptional regulator [Bacteroidetes bacterium]|nr:MAG: transcriptional regulator [Bacteroidota bacterium]